MTSSSTHFHQFRLDFSPSQFSTMFLCLKGNFQVRGELGGRARSSAAQKGQFLPEISDELAGAVSQGTLLNCGLWVFLSDMFCLN